jgi:hypothetical protein
LKTPVPRAPGRGRRQRRFFYFFENNLCQEPLAEAVNKDSFSIFYTKFSLPSTPCNYARQSWEHQSWEIFFQSCRAYLQGTLGKGAFADGPLGNEATFFFFPH